MNLVLETFKYLRPYAFMDAKQTSIWIRVESGSDDPDYLGHLGHFFGGSSGSHPQTKLSGCDPDF